MGGFCITVPERVQYKHSAREEEKRADLQRQIVKSIKSVERPPCVYIFPIEEIETAFLVSENNTFYQYQRKRGVDYGALLFDEHRALSQRSARSERPTQTPPTTQSRLSVHSIKQHSFVGHARCIKICRNQCNFPSGSAPQEPSIDAFRRARSFGARGGPQDPGKVPEKRVPKWKNSQLPSE